MPFFEYSVFYTVLCIESADAFQKSPDMFPHAQHLVLLQNKSIPSSFIEAFFIAEKSILFDWNHNRPVTRYLLFTLWSRFCIFDKWNQKFLQSVHAFGEVLSECIEKLTISDWRFADYFF